jgi:outer membrane receptor protein involved in Fe transport
VTPASLAALLMLSAPVAGQPASTSPRPHQEAITVTAAAVPTRLVETPAALTLLDAEEIAMAPALALDDLLRQVPGFTLFRRSGSRTANPTTQGASLRGVGGSGASRALVLADGVPLNDPFGGWVAWGRVPRLSLARVEVLRGGASDLWGTGALAGVVQLVRRPAAGPALLVEASAGEQGTAAGDVWAAWRGGGPAVARGGLGGDAAVAGPWGVTVAAERTITRGAIPVARAERGAVDEPAGGRHASHELTLDRQTARGARLFARGSAFDERRRNGTPLQDNTTWLRELALGADLPVAGGGAELRLWTTRERYLQTFSVVAPGRGSETSNRDQRVPSRLVGGTTRWTHPLGDALTVVAGVEARRTRGESDERLFLPGRVVPSATGGSQDLAGAFIEGLLLPSRRWTLAAGLRGDWLVSAAGAGAPPGGEKRRARALSPRLAVRVQASPAWSLDLSAYRSFRAPTLNELYRGFRVGNVVTDANPRLGPERLVGAELGAGWRATAPRPTRLRATLFWMELSDAIANVTLSVAPDLTRRRRENLGRTRSRGIELEGEWEPRRGLTVEGSWLLVESTVESFGADPSLVGRRVAQVPRGSGALTLRWHGERLDATLAARGSGRAFEDDRNALPLDSFALLDAQLARPLADGVALFVAGENLLDEEYVVGRAGVTTVGTPRLVRAGVRYRRGGG